ncbi:MAG: PKD domain-containing protein, partial [Crocinitomicaceae bacterium]|nr:PKD domain-containing protein [Crocinitomicaceae bacterium]
DCGNQITVDQIIVVNDTIAPTASAPDTIFVQCNVDIPIPDITVVTTESDNCTAVPVVAHFDDASNGLSCPETITRTYSVTDDCGNQITIDQIILVNDTIAPTASAPAPLTVECLADAIVDVSVVTDEADNCAASPIVAHVGDVSDGLTCPETITRTYSVTDDCGNQITVDQIITVDDITAPTASAPVALAVECIGDVPAIDILVVTDEADNCTANPIVAHVGDVSDGLTCPETITRTYSVTDDCGNQITVDQIIVVNDTIAPTASAPDSAFVQCIGDVPAVDVLVVNDEADNCTVSPAVAHVGDVSDGLTCPETITRTYSVTDDCGNQITVDQIIVVNDTIAPTASAPDTIFVQCTGDIPIPDIAVVTDAADNCTAAPVVAHVDDIGNGLSCPETITRIYSLTDDCGNQFTVDQIIIVNDTIAPTASTPDSIFVQCIGDVPTVDVLDVTDEADNCTVSPVVAHLGDATDGLTCPETITRTYSVTDDCGNQITVDQIIVVNDTIAPTASAPDSVFVQCIGDVPAVDTLVVNDEVDNCTANPVVAHLGDVSDGLTCPETITRTYSVTDDCGNQITVDQIIVVNDTIAPTASAPIAVNVECIGDVPVVDTLVVTDALDNCTANPVVAHVGDVSDGLTCPETITRTYSVTDDCGNQITVDQIITVNDVTPPTAQNVPTINVPGTMDVPAPDPSVVLTEADNCTPDPVVAWVSDVSDGNVCNNEEITRTYSITDDCGNETLITHLIIIDAVPAPIDAGLDQLICIGESANVIANNPLGVPIVWDPIGPDGNVSPTQTTTYTVTADNLGCISIDSMTVTVEELPVVSFFGDVLQGCESHTVNFLNTSITSSNFADCIWEFSNGDTVTGCGSVSYSFLDGGLYDVTLTTTSINGCVNSETYTDYIYIENFADAAFSPSETVVTNIMTEVLFLNESQNATDYSWDFGDDTAGSSDVNPSHVFPDQEADIYNVELIANTPLGCADTAYALITVNEEVLCYVPNTFTPDGDQFNQYFQPVFASGYDPSDFKLLIFNRWGEVIWESNDASIGWDGTYGGNQDLVQSGTYAWKIEFGSSQTDENFVLTGHVTLLK